MCFPGIGLGAVACRARTLPDALFLAARPHARRSGSTERPGSGGALSALRDIRKISLAIAVSVATKAYAMNLAREKRRRVSGEASRPSCTGRDRRIDRPSLTS